MKTFRAVVVVAGEAQGAGEGRTKKEAEQAAALEACERLTGAASAAPGQQVMADHDARGGAATGTGGHHG